MTVVTSSNRGRPREDIRAQLFEASIALFREKGFAPTSVDAIVARAGVAKGTFFNFFPSKVDVLKAYYGRIDAEIAHIRAALDPADPAQSLRRYAAAVEAIFIREGRLMIELLGLALNDPAIRRIDEASGSLDAEEFAAFFTDAKAQGALRTDVDPAAAAAAVIDLWGGAVRLWLIEPVAGALCRHFERRLAVLFAGLRP